MARFSSHPILTKTAPQRDRSTKPGAIRMQRLLERRRRGFRCCVVEYSPRDLDALVARGFMDRLQRDDQAAVEKAIGAVLDQL